MVPWVLIFFVAVVLIFLQFQIAQNRKPKRKLAPGPTIWPIIGNLFEIKAADPEYPHLAFAKLAKKYGNVMGLGFGMTYVVVISGYEEMKTILKKSETNEDRFEFPYVTDRSYNQKLGIIWGCGDAWQEIRRFTMRSFRDFGYEKKDLMDFLIREETDAIVKEIRNSAKKQNGIWDVDSHILAAFTLNVLWIFVGGYRFDHKDEVLHENLRLNDESMAIFSHVNIYNAFPFLKRWFPKLVRHDAHMKVHEAMQVWMKGIVDKIREKRAKRLDINAQSFVEAFCDEIEKNRGTPSNFTEEQLIVTLLDLFIGGSETTSMTLNWAVLYLTMHPKCQEKLQLEIKEANEHHGGHISIQEASKLPYMNAVLLEVSRLGNVGPIPPARATTENVYFEDFVIPKGTALFPNITGVVMDEKFWGDPKEFRPERFLNDSGTIIPEMADRVAVFGFGKRRCPGEIMAIDNVTLFLMAVFENFTLSVIEGREPSPEKPVATLTIKPRPFSVRAVPIH